ncbi:hypothetical protein [Mycolicibacterium lutetiense]
MKSAQAGVTGPKASTQSAQNAFDKADAEVNKLKAEGKSADKITAAEKKRDVAQEKLTAAQERQSAAETRLSEVKDKEAQKAGKATSGGPDGQSLGQSIWSDAGHRTGRLCVLQPAGMAQHEISNGSGQLGRRPGQGVGRCRQ